MTTNGTHLKRHASALFMLMLFILLAIDTHAAECRVPCINTSDYQHPNSFLHFSREHFPPDYQLKGTADSSANGRWRHRFDIVITQNDSEVSVFDRQGSRHNFKINGDGKYIPSSIASGTLSMNSGRFHWLNSEGILHKFQGSYLTEITSSANETLKLQYRHRKLESISDAQGKSIKLNYQNDSLASLTTPQGTTIELTSQACLSPTDTEPETCNTEEHSLDDFNSAPTRPGVVTVDARPASCESYFVEYFGATRGSEIERGISTLAPYRSLQTTVRSFPIVDFVSNNEWFAVRSRDLASPSFNDEKNPNALFYRLMRDGREIQDRFLTPLQINGFVTAEEDGVTTTLEAGVEPPNLTLQLVIRHQIASPTHWQQISRARELLAQRYDIHLDVVLIP